MILNLLSRSQVVSSQRHLYHVIERGLLHSKTFELKVEFRKLTMVNIIED